MLTVQTEKHRLRNSKTELYGGTLVPPFECPERVEIIMKRISEVGLGEVIEPESFGMAPIERIHDKGFLDFLATCWSEWQAEGFEGEAIAPNWPARRMAQRRKISEGARGAFALCRPPGHHAASDLFGGYCFLNNAAIAAQAWRDEGAERVAVLDVDFHHGNGTQDIFYQRDDVLFVSLHGEPENAFPYFLGYADETGAGKGEGFNINYPLPEKTGFERWSECLEDACRKIADYGPDALVVSLGVDTFKEDPISFFKLDSDDYLTYGERIGKMGLPTLFCMEGGYAVEQVGINTVNVLQGFEQA